MLDGHLVGFDQAEDLEESLDQTISEELKDQERIRRVLGQMIGNRPWSESVIPPVQRVRKSKRLPLKTTWKTR